MLGMRQTTGPTAIYVYTQNNVVTPQTVYLTSSDTLVVTVPDSVIIPTNTNYVYFPINAMDTIGHDPGPGHRHGIQLATMSVQVTQPKFVDQHEQPLNTTSARYAVTVYAEDQNGHSHYTTDTVFVHLASSAIGVANIDSSVVAILPSTSTYYNNHATWGPASLTTPGTAQLSATDTTAALYAYQPATFNVTVGTPALELHLGHADARHRAVQQPVRLLRPTTPVAVSVAFRTPARRAPARLCGGPRITTVTIPGHQLHVLPRGGTAVGMDTLVALGDVPPFIPATAYTAVSLGHVDPLGSWPTALSVSGTDSVQFIAVRARLDDGDALRPGQHDVHADGER